MTPNYYEVTDDVDALRSWCESKRSDVTVHQDKYKRFYIGTGKGYGTALLCNVSIGTVLFFRNNGFSSADDTDYSDLEVAI